MKNILIIGAGVAGSDVAREISTSPELKMSVVGYVDDDKLKVGTVVEGFKVLCTSQDIKKVIRSNKVDEIIIAIPSALGDDIDKFVNIAIRLNISYKIVPRVKEIIDGRASLSSVRKVDIQDLLGRPVIKKDVAGLKKFFNQKVVLITGAAGSIGSELSLQIAAYKPKKLILFDIWENGIFELKQKFDNLKLIKNIEYVIGNIQDLKRLENIFLRHSPNFVFHAAAYKHVPLMEENPLEALKNNIIGTYNVASTSIENKVERFVLVSTDKAADPKNVMGYTKLFAENIAASFKGSTKFTTNVGTKFTTNVGTKFMIVRFGNVLNSNGSVIPIFRKQIETGGPITITDKRMTRYFMTIPEASGLIIKSAFLGKGGELFVLDMGKPMSILNLAEKMIRLSGFIPGKDIKIIYTGIRKGEKLTEKLFTTIEKLDTTEDGKIFVAKKGIPFKNLDLAINKIRDLVLKDSDNDVLLKLKEIMTSSLK